MRFDKYLTPEERIQAWKEGLTYKLAEKEILPSEFDEMVKSAQEKTNYALLPLKLLLWSALITGGGIGVVNHLVGQAVGTGGAKNDSLRRKRNYMRDVTARIKSELEATGETEDE